HQTGLSFDQTIGILSAFSDHALIGSDAGTSLKTMLQRLTPQSSEAKAMMEKLGFSAYDSAGNFVGLTKMADNMKTSFGNLSPEARNAAMNTIFGSDAVRAATIVYELGGKGVDKYTKAVNDNGAAARMASIQTDNLSGDFERLKGAIEVALIEGGSSANGALRTMTQWVTKLVNAYNNLPPGLQHTVTLMSGVGGAATLAVAGFLLLIPRIQATRTALTQMGLTAARTRTILGVMGQVGAVVAGLELISYATQKVRDQFKDAPVSTAKMTNSLVDLANHGKISGEGLNALGGNLDKFGEAVQRIAHPTGEARTTDIVNSLTLNLTKGLMEAQIPLDEAHDKLKSVDDALAELAQGGNADLAAKSFDKLSAAAAKDGTSKEKLLTLLPQYSDALAGLDTQGKTAAAGQGELADAASTTADALQDQRTEAEKLADALNTLNGVNISAGEKEISFRQSVADLTTAVKENGHSLDVTSEKGRKVKSAFLDAAQAAMDHAQAVADQKNSQEAGQAVLEKDITLLQKQMLAAGFSKDAVKSLTAAYLQLPAGKTTDVKANTSKAVKDLENVQAKLRGTKGKSVTVSALTKTAEQNLKDLGFKVTHMKNGKVSITIPTGTPKAAISDIQRAINNMSGKTVGIGVYTTEYYKKVQKGPSIPGITKHAHGGLVGYAGGGAVQYAPNGLLRGPGTGTSDSILARFASGSMARVSNTEFVVNAASTKKYLPLLTAINANKIPGFASGGLLGGFTYTPTGMAVLGGPSDAKQRYDGEIEDLKKAWDDLNKALATQKKAANSLKDAEKNLAYVRKHHHTATQLRAAEEKVSKAKSAKKSADKTVSSDRAKVNAADKELGLKKGAKTPKTFNLKAYETQLDESVAATTKWRSSLTKIGQRGGKELQSMLEGMGEDGYALVNSLAGASDKQFKSITDKLQKTGEYAKATLKDFTKQLNGSTKESQQFAADLQTLAGKGFGDLAQALAAQGDSSAMTLAHQAATGGFGDVAAANIAVSNAQNTLTGDDLLASLTLLSTLRSGPGKGFADLIAAGLDVATIKSIVPKMTKQISGLPEANKATFVRQWVQQGGKAMALGGILSRPTMVLGGEAGVRESWIPWNNSVRSKALLAKTASALGYQLVPAGRYGAGRVSAAEVAREITRNTYVTLNGAKQSAAEQAHDIARVINFIG
ncbi:phage tail tape measure protein, partial [Streptomyces sp. NBC_00847]|uniref:phage tail tape measure protein n=1 Tax=Streptomyces sp. NBC_00847 TaxID=2975850 RepID=UPI00225DD570